MLRLRSRIESFVESTVLGKQAAPQEPPTTVANPRKLVVGADSIPPELFQRILYFVGRDDRRKEVEKQAHQEARRNNTEVDPWELLLKLEKASPSYGLRSCSHVSRYWGNQSRQYLFHDRMIRITTLEEAETFRRYSTQGCPKLWPISKFIKGFDVVFSYSDHSKPISKAFIHLLYLPATRTKLLTLTLSGPFPTSLPPSKLDTPHWSLPNTSSNLSPSITPYQTVSLSHMRFPSFIHIIKYIKHFRHATSMTLDGVTWTEAFNLPSLTYLPQSARFRRHSTRVAVRGCTNDVLLCWQAAMMYSDFPLRKVHDREQYWVYDLMTDIRSFYDKDSVGDPKGSMVRVTLSSYSPGSPEDQSSLVVLGISYGPNDVNPGPRTSFELHLTCDVPPLSPNSLRRGLPPQPIRIMSAMVYIRDDPAAVYVHSDVPSTTTTTTTTTFDFSIFRRAFNRHGCLRSVVFAFEHHADLQRAMDEHPGLALQQQQQHPLGRQTRYRLVYHQHTHSDTWVFLDPVTLLPTGEKESRRDRLVTIF
ncbi:hypothetical protein BDY19DRAFT_988041 [Irpex rosettiformis]|uniref:Uncharacterized protein n=1 Tax=Irpex rosettiformis TaxID=378272 RepID=A0ACB8UJA8_9APHY|nr:hypothetical protein BDY19DRAFT_988041 [Irpex rosettiformis]